MNTSSTVFTLDTPIEELNKFSNLNRDTLLLLKESGAQNMQDVLNINPYEFQKMKGVGPDAVKDLFEFQEKYRRLSYTKREEWAKLLDKAAQICVSKHAGQRDKMGRAYFQHPMRVAMRCNSDDEKIVALLHDTIEDTDVTAEYLLAEGFPQYIIDGILSVTKREGEDYNDFVARAAQNPLGRVVKLHDIEDNLDVFRLDTVSPDMAARFSKYLAAYKFLLAEKSEAPFPGVNK